MKKRFTILIVSLLTFTTGIFLLAGCGDDTKNEEISDFERNHGERYLKEYTYYYTELYEYNEEYEKYWPVYTWWDKDSSHESVDDLRGYNYLINYRDGKSDNEEWNAIFLQGKEFVEELGKSITVNLNDITFSGTLEAIPIEFSEMQLPGSADLDLVLTKEEKDRCIFRTFEIRYHGPSEKSRGSFIMSFWTKPTIIAGKKYQMNFNYWATLAPGDTDWHS